MKRYDPKTIESKWQLFWQVEKTFEANDSGEKQKKYVLVEFPYPSGIGLHMGHLRPYVAADVYARYYRMKGFEVLFPIGWDAFGLPAENFAIKNGIHPSVSTAQNVENAKSQILSWGLSFDWNREINTTDPDYYKWTQWIFLQFYKAGLAYESTGLINWCPKDKTGLANEEVVDGKCERCGTAVEKKELRQWYLRITQYADKLLEGLKTLSQWPEAVKIQQENWIGKSVGAEIEFPVKGMDVGIDIFTTRPDTIYGATYLVLAPEHPLLENIKNQISNIKDVERYIEEAGKKEEVERAAEGKEKTGVELKGISAINPATGKEIPVWIADYVLAGYGTGAIMAVPAHDQRDFEFAQKFGLPVVEVIQKPRQKMALLLHGTNGHGGNSWFPWLKEKLANLGYTVVAPTLPEPGKPDMGSWLKALSQYESLIDDSSLMVGHSLGCQTALQLLQKTGKRVNHLVMVAPTHGGMDWQTYKDKHPESPVENIKAASQLPVDFALIQTLANKITFLFSDNDPHIPLEVRDMFAQVMKADFSVLKGRGHFSESANIREIPELMDAVIDNPPREEELSSAMAEHGVLVNSGEYSGQASSEALPKMGEKFGRMSEQYKLRDWVFSRQRYWGEPIPIIHCGKCGIVPVPDNMLPVRLPDVENYEPTGTGESRLAAIDEWVNTVCPACGGQAKRETNTMPQWAGSSWYWLRYTDPKNASKFASKEKLTYWTPVDVYFGGMEHTTLHLLYSRFWNLFLYDQGLVTAPEPYLMRKPHGIVLGPDGEKMSKSRGNVVNPDEFVEKFGADSLRMYELFLGPHETMVSWSDQGILGVRRFLDRVWTWVEELKAGPHDPGAHREDTEKVQIALNKLIKKITEDIENFRFNTAISSFMEFHNEIKQEFITMDSVRVFLRLLYPFAPHIAEEFHYQLDGIGTLQTQEWPVFDPEKVMDKTVELVVQVAGKVKAKLQVPFGSGEDVAKPLALENDGVKKALDGKEVKKVIFVQNRLINFVI